MIKIGYYVCMSKKTLIPLIIVLAVAGAFLIGRFGLKLGSWEYNSYGEFISNSSPLRLSVSIPEGASDQRFYCNNTLIGKYSLYAFTVDKAEYDQFIRSVILNYGNGVYSEYYLKKTGEVQNPGSYGDSFPLDLDYDKVISDNIGSYYIILFDPMHSGSSSSALVANPDTGRIVVVNIENLR